MLPEPVWTRLLAVLCSNPHLVLVLGRVYLVHGHMWPSTSSRRALLQRTAIKGVRLIKSNTAAISGGVLQESRLLCLFVNGFFTHSVSAILLHPRCKPLSVILRYSYIDISLKKKNAKRRPLSTTLLAWARWSAGSSSEKNTRVATPRAFTWSCVTTGRIQIDHYEARSLAKALQKEWWRNSQWWEQAEIMKLELVLIRH